MSGFLEFLSTVLSQFAGGPGPIENNLVRFGLSAIMWGILLAIAWSRQREQDLPREKMLIWGFGLFLAREGFMLIETASRILMNVGRDTSLSIHQPLEHALGMAAIVVIAAAYIRFVLNDARPSMNYLVAGLIITAICLLVTALTLPNPDSISAQISFHQTWQAWLFHAPLSVLILIAVGILWRKRGWLTRVVSIALLFFLISEVLTLIGYATENKYNPLLCPIGNSFHMLAIPLLGFVYLREMSIEKRRAEKDLETYRNNLEDQVKERTSKLISVNKQLKKEIFERLRAEEALEQLSHRYELILESAGEGICGIDPQGRSTFINPAAARMLGYQVDELIGKSCHKIWHQFNTDNTIYPEEECPICQGYRNGIAHYGEDLVFWRKDSSNFPVRYASTPIYEKDELAGTVVVFRDITERKQAEAEIVQRSTRLAALNAIAATISKSLELDKILNAALDMALSVLNMELGALYLLDPEKEKLALQIHRGSVPLDEIPESLKERCSCVRISTQAINEMRAVVQKVADCPAEQLTAYLDNEGIQSLISAPLVSKGQVMGALTLGTQRAEAVQQFEIELLTAIGQQVGMAIENAHLYQQAERWAEELTLLHQVSITLSSTLDLERIHDEITEQSARLSGCQMACIFSWARDSDRVELISSYGIGPPEQEILRVGDSAYEITRNLYVDRQSTAIDNALIDPRVPGAWKEELKVKTLFYVPVRSAEDPLEFLFLMDQRAVRRWRPEEIKLVESFVNRAAVALENANLHKQLEWAATLEERQRIAAVMHDGLAQTLSLLGLKVDGVTEFVSSGVDGEAVDRLQDIRETVEQALIEVRRSIASLQEIPKPQQPIQGQLFDLVSQIYSADGPAVDLINKLDEPIFLSAEQSAQVLPLVQEALLNAQRHASADCIRLTLKRHGDHLSISVEDNGIGFDPGDVPLEDEGHFGLSIMRARAAQIGANLQITSSPGRGAQVKLNWLLDSEGIKSADGI